jgi:hypothetical protein
MQTPLRFPGRRERGGDISHGRNLAAIDEETWVGGRSSVCEEDTALFACREGSQVIFFEEAIHLLGCLADAQGFARAEMAQWFLPDGCIEVRAVVANIDDPLPYRLAPAIGDEGSCAFHDHPSYADGSATAAPIEDELIVSLEGLAHALTMGFILEVDVDRQTGHHAEAEVTLLNE